jgi:hypothetical protein
LAQRFEIKAAALKLATLIAVGQSAKTPEDATTCITFLIKTSDEAIHAADLETAEKCLSSAASLAKSAKLVPLVTKVDARSKRLGSIKTRIAAVQKAQDTLVKDPENADANAIVGEHLCIVNEAWEQGLPLLNKGSNARLKSAATFDLANPTEAPAQVEAGDAWWALAEKEADDRKTALQRRASLWYGKAKGGVTGLVKAKVEKRIAEVPVPEVTIPAEADARAQVAWRPTPAVAVSANKSTIRDAIGLLGADADYSISVGDVNPSMQVTFSGKNMGVVEAIDGLCRAAGVGYIREDTGFRLTKTKMRDAATVGLGPFLLSSRIVKSTDGAKISLWIGAEWEPRVDPVWYEITLEGVTDEAGKAVEAVSPQNAAGIVRDANLSNRLGPKFSQITREQINRDFYTLTNAPAPGGKLRSIRGKVEFFFPLKAHRVRFDKPMKGATATAGGHTVTLSSLQYIDDGRWLAGIELDLGGIDANKRFPLHAAMSRTLLRFTEGTGPSREGTHQSYGGRSFGTKEGTLTTHSSTNLTSKEKNTPPTCIETDVLTDVWSRVYSFEFTNVPYPKP